MGMLSEKSSIASLFCLVLLSWTITMLLAPMIGEIADDFGLASEVEVGNVSAAFLLVGGFVAFIWVAIDDRFSKRSTSSRKHLLVFATVVWALGLYLTSLSRNYPALFASQMLAAVGCGAITPLAYSLAVDLTHPENRAKVIGLLDLGGMIGGGFGFLLAGLLIDFVPWNVPCLLVGTFGLIMAGFALEIHDPKRGGQEDELREIMDQGAEYDYHLSKEGISKMLSNRTNLLLLLLNGVLMLSSGAISYYFIRMMVNDHGFSSSLAVLFFLLVFVAQAIGVMFWTRRADQKFLRSKSGKVKVLLQSLLVGPFFLIVAYTLAFNVTDLAMIGLFALLLMVGMFFLSGVFAISFTIFGEVNPPEMRTTIFSLNNLSQTLGRAAGTAIMGVFFIFFSNTYHLGFMIMSIFYLVGIVLIIPMLKTVPKELRGVRVLLSERAREIGQREAEPE